MLSSALATATGKIEVCAWLDDDDPTVSQYPRVKEVVYGSGPRIYENGILTTSSLWQRAWELGTGDIAMLCADDVLFRTPGWDAAVEAEFKKVPDKILMVYPYDGSQRQAPVNPFVSREWIEAAGELTPPSFQGWFSDEWIWAQAAELERVVYLKDVLVQHMKAFAKPDPTYRDGQAARQQVGGLAGMRLRFYSVSETLRRDAQTKQLKNAMKSEIKLVPKPVPAWFKESIELSETARASISTENKDTVISVHCYQGDAQLVKDKLSLYLHHGCPVAVLSPKDSPVKIDHPNVDSFSIGKRAYYGKDSLDRQKAHIKLLLKQYPKAKFFLLNDADSMCLSPDLPRYLYESKDTLWSNEVPEKRPHKSPYPKIGLQPPYFASRKALERMMKVSSRVETHPITPFVDWYMLALACEADVAHKNFLNADGASFPAWRYDKIDETTTLGHDYQHQNVRRGRVDGALRMRQAVGRGAIFIHSVKHPEVQADLVKARASYVQGRSRRVSAQVLRPKQPDPIVPMDQDRVAVIIPLSRTLSPPRQQAWDWIKQRYAALLPDIQLLIGYDYSKPFSKTIAVNSVYQEIDRSRDIIVVADADSWMEPEALLKECGRAASTDRLVIPWQTVVRLTRGNSVKILSTPPTSPLAITPEMIAHPEMISPIPQSAGTMFVITRRAFETVCGMDPRFGGWGLEDVAFRRACDTLVGKTIYRSKEVCYSFWHERPRRGRGRVWDDDDGGHNSVLNARYRQAEHDRRRMRQLCNEHPLKGVDLPDDSKAIRLPDGVVMTVNGEVKKNRTWAHA